MLVLIPAYQPDERLVDLVHAVLAMGPDVRCLVVNDGSGERFDAVFAAAAAAGAHVIAHHPNKGKGYTLKQGFAHIALRYPGESVVCADCDGQHTPADIRRVMDAVAAHPGSMVLGVRAFAGHVPFRSRFGNAMTTRFFAAATRSPLKDTQTGMRGYPPSLLRWLCTIPGERFEYELSVLLAATRERIPVHEVDIATVYVENNATSHFRPVQDSVRIYWPLLKFAASSLLAFAIDTGMLLLMHGLTGTVVLSAVAARAVSSGVNFSLNRALVFRDRGRRGVRVQALQYWLLVIGLFCVNVLILTALTAAGMALLPAKLITEAALFTGSFGVQRTVIFARGGRTAATESPRVGAADTVAQGN